MHMTLMLHGQTMEMKVHVCVSQVCQYITIFSSNAMVLCEIEVFEDFATNLALGVPSSSSVELKWIPTKCK